MYPRYLQAAVEKTLADTPVVLLHGPRQSGKTTLVRALGESRKMRFVTPDDATALASARHDPDGFLSGLGSSVVIDEVQRATELLVAVKASVDRKRTPGRFLLTGSANVLFLPRLSESLAGRMETLTLLPLSQGELRETRESFIERAFADVFEPGASNGASVAGGVIEAAVRGGYPEAIARPDDERRGAWFGSYLTAILQRDVRDLANVEGLTEMPRLLSLLASRSAGLLNYSDLSRSISIPQTTLKRYFTLLETTFLVRTLPGWSSNTGLRLTKAPKIHLVDTGLLAHLAGITLARVLTEPQLGGSLLESFVVGEVAKQRGWSKVSVQMYHFRTPSNREVDLVLEDPRGHIVGIEIKSSASVNAKDFLGLKALREIAGKKFVRGFVLNTGSNTVPFDGQQLLALPIVDLWT